MTNLAHFTLYSKYNSCNATERERVILSVVEPGRGQMRRFLHRSLKRGHIADRVATLLLFGLLAILAASLLQGVRHIAW
jgi:hypothetical protein